MRPEAHDHEPVRLAAAERHLPGAVVERQEVQQLGELDLLEPTGQAHGCSGSAGPSSIGAPGCEPADAAHGLLGLRPGPPAQHPRERRQRGRGGRADRAERLHGGLAHAAVAVGDGLRELGHRWCRRIAHVLQRHRRRHAQLGVGIGERRRQVGHGGAAPLPHAPERVGRRDPLGGRAGAQHLRERRRGGLPELQQLQPRLAARLGVRAAQLGQQPRDVGLVFLRRQRRRRPPGRAGRGTSTAARMPESSSGARTSWGPSPVLVASVIWRR